MKKASPVVATFAGRARRSRASLLLQAGCARRISGGSYEAALPISRLIIDSAVKPHGHSWLKFRHIALRIEAQAQRIAIVIADRALGLPGRERPERQELSDDGRCAAPT
jgi:hypothetical protein